MTVEIMIAFSLCVLFTVSIFSLVFSIQRLKEWSVVELGKVRESVRSADRGVFASSSEAFGNDTVVFSNDYFSLSNSDYKDAWGRTTCSPRFGDIEFDAESIEYFSQGIELGATNKSTDIEVRNGVVYLAADANSSLPHDIYIVDARTPTSSTLISSLNTGPGLSALEVAGPYVFVAQMSTVFQLQIIDIADRTHPALLASFRLPTPTPSTTPPFATAIFYKDGLIYLGTEKWVGPEFFVIDVSNISSPAFVGSFETNTLINDIYVRDHIAYLADSNNLQLRMLDVSVPSAPVLIDSFSPSGWQTQEGKTLEYFEGALTLGRTVGGFNVSGNHEAFIFPTSTDISQRLSRDIPGGVYGSILRPPYVFLLTHAPSAQFQVWDSTFATKLFETSLGVDSVKMACDYSTFYFATGDHRGFSVLKFIE